MDVPEVIPLPIAPEPQKGISPSAVKRSHPPFHDPRKQGEAPPHRERERRREREPQGHVTPDEVAPNEDVRGTRIDLRA